MQRIIIRRNIILAGIVKSSTQGCVYLYAILVVWSAVFVHVVMIITSFGNLALPVGFYKNAYQCL